MLHTPASIHILELDTLYSILPDFIPLHEILFLTQGSKTITLKLDVSQLMLEF